MRKPKPYRARRISLLVPILLAAITIIQSCRKLAIDAQGKAATENRFFATKQPLPSAVAKVLQKMKDQNSKKGFVTGFVQHEGYALWDKAVIRTAKAKRIFGRSSDGSSTDTTVLVPIVLENTDYVTSFIAATVSDTAYINLWQGSKYAGYGFTDSSNATVSANKIAAQIMLLDNSTFGYTKFKVKDRRLFAHAPQNLLPVGSFVKIQTSNSTGRDLSDCGWVDIWYDPDGDDDPCDCSGNEYYDHTEWHGPCETGQLETFNWLNPEIFGSPSGGGNYFDPYIPPTDPNNPTGGGWEPVLTPPSRLSIEDYLKNLINGVHKQSDSIYAVSLSFNPTIEYGFLVCQRATGDPYARNIRTDGLRDEVSYNRNIQPDETIVALLHTHPDADTTLLQAPSDGDLSGLRKFEDKQNFVKFVECGTKRYALVITDPVKATAFFNTHPYEDMDKNFTSYYASQPNNLSVSVITEQWLIQYLGASGICGIGFYIATNLPEKNNFVKLN